MYAWFDIHNVCFLCTTFLETIYLYISWTKVIYSECFGTFKLCVWWFLRNIMIKWLYISIHMDTYIIVLNFVLKLICRKVWMRINIFTIQSYKKYDRLRSYFSAVSSHSYLFYFSGNKYGLSLRTKSYDTWPGLFTVEESRFWVRVENTLQVFKYVIVQ